MGHPALAWRLTAEAMIALAVTRAVLALLPFRVAVRWLGLRLATEEHSDSGGATAPIVPLMGDAVLRAASMAPFRAVCLQQAIAAAILLRLRGHAVQVHFGVSLDAQGALSAHAWSRCQGFIVTGGRQMAGFQPISMFVT